MITIENPPLVSFRIDFKFKKPEKVSFEMMAKVEKILKKEYTNVPSLKIIEYPFDVPFRVEGPIQIGPMKFVNEEKNGEVQLFSDGLIFIFTKYSHWDEIKEQIINLLFDYCKVLNIREIEQLRMEYIDEFPFPKENFELQNYFNLNINKPENWSLDYTDFHIGIKIISNNDIDKFIIRLRGLVPKQNETFLFRLESIYVKRKEFLIEKKEELLSELNSIHDLIIEYFLDIMNEKLKKSLGVSKK